MTEEFTFGSSSESMPHLELAHQRGMLMDLCASMGIGTYSRCELTPGFIAESPVLDNHGCTKLYMMEGNLHGSWKNSQLLWLSTVCVPQSVGNCNHSNALFSTDVAIYMNMQNSVFCKCATLELIVLRDQIYRVEFNSMELVI